MTYGDYGSAGKAVTKFVRDELINAALDADPPKTLNVPQEFASFLVAGRVNKLVADEVAEKQRGLIRFRLDEALNQWAGLGLPAPVGYAENEEIILTWKHDRYADITGQEPLSPQFVETYNWLNGLGARDFLFPCATFLKIIGCDPIFITDGPRDEGIDCIGKIANGPMRSVLFFVQCKTRQRGTKKVFGKELLYQEYGKYATLPKTQKYRDYLRALDHDDCRDGAASVYVVVTNGEFDRNAQEVARKLGILLRSARQIAYFLALYSNPEILRSIHANITIPNGPDLNKNLSSQIPLPSR